MGLDKTTPLSHSFMVTTRSQAHVSEPSTLATRWNPTQWQLSKTISKCRSKKTSSSTDNITRSCRLYKPNIQRTCSHWTKTKQPGEREITSAFPCSRKVNFYSSRDMTHFNKQRNLVIDNAVVDAIKLILLIYNNFSIVKKVVNKIVRVK